MQLLSTSSFPSPNKGSRMDGRLNPGWPLLMFAICQVELRPSRRKRSLASWGSGLWAEACVSTQVQRGKEDLGRWSAAGGGVGSYGGRQRQGRLGWICPNEEKREAGSKGDWRFFSCLIQMCVETPWSGPHTPQMRAPDVSFITHPPKSPPLNLTPPLSLVRAYTHKRSS